MAELISNNGRTIQEIVAARFVVPVDDIKPETRLADDIGCDSLDSVELCMTIEKEFGVAIPDEQWEKVTTVGDIANLVTSKTQPHEGQ